MFGFSRYNYDRFEKATLLKDLAGTKFGSAPEPGDKAPDFELRTLDGEKVKLSDFRGDKNVVLTFGSATCPLSAGSISGLNELYEEFNGDNVHFLYVYVREAHPGENLPAHRSNDDKVAAAERFREEEEIEIPVLVDDLNGKVHRKYGSLPNPTFLIDKGGRISFRALATRARVIEKALDELIERQKERGVDHVVVNGGEDAMMPSVKSMMHAHRALERGGTTAIDDFRREMGMPGRAVLAASRVVRPVADHPGATVGAAAAVVGVVGLGLWAGLELRRRRLSSQQPYTYPNYKRRFSDRHRDDRDDYEAVGI
jgi:peroxiredoxin